MLSIQHLYQTEEELVHALSAVNVESDALVQIFTNCLEPDAALSLAQRVQKLLPKASIIGSSVNGIIYKGQQYDCHTMVTVEQYEVATTSTHLMDFGDMTYSDIAIQVMGCCRSNMPSMIRMFVGAYYDYAHQLISALNVLMPNTRLAGGMSGELHQSKTVPFVFDATQVVHNGLVFATLAGEVSLYNRIHTSHDPISPAYTITGTTGRAIDTIENQPAQQWLQRNLGFLSTKEYTTWEDIAANDPLVRFQLALVSHERAVRYLRYEESTQTIGQYFSRLDPGTQFRISYISPSKCVEECAQTCREVAQTSMEQLFCYSCLFRKLYLKNCAQWEISPFHKNPVSGVFLLGEFGCANGANTLLNGSCVLNGIGEGEHYLQVDTEELAKMESIQDESEGLVDFIQNKQLQTLSQENRQLLDDMILRENNYQAMRLQYLDPNFKIGNLLKFEQDKVRLAFNKLALVKIENAETLVGYLGASTYYHHLQTMVKSLSQRQRDNAVVHAIRTYALNVDTFALAVNDEMGFEDFVSGVKLMRQRCEEIQEEFPNCPFMLRMAVVSGHELLLERGYRMLERHKNSQSRLVVENADVEQNQLATSHEELQCITMIKYALAEGGIVPYYQGIQNNITGKIDCYEALMRLRDKDGNIWGPAQFMDTAKKYRLYLELNLGMMELVLRDFAAVDCAVNINLSAHDIASPRFRRVLSERLKTFHKPENLTFEFLEDECFNDLGALKDFILEVRSYGAKVAIDDFGAGYSNLLELMKIRPDYLKIDGQIVSEIHKYMENEVIVDVICSLADKLSMDVVAEFVENQEIQTTVEKYKILRSQGYYFAKPQPFQQISEQLNHLKQGGKP